MKRVFNIVLFSVLVFTSFLLSGCASGNNFQFVSEDYKDKKQSNVTIMAIPYIAKALSQEQRTFFIDKKSKQNRPVSSREIELMENYIKSLLSENTFAKIIIPDPNYNFSSVKFEYANVSDNEKNIFEAFVPKNQISYNNEIPDYIMIVEDIFFIRDVKNQDVSMGRGSQTSFKFEGGIEYLLWDNKNNKAAAYGRLNKKSELLEFPTKDQYMQVLDIFFASIIEKSPIFRKELKF